jgi:gliding motility-associated protein GldM
MISMMYLVYTAMLALNVSAEILTAFKTVGDSMEITNKLLLQKSETSYQLFENAYKANQEKVAENWNKALEVKKATREMLDYIDNVKYELVAVTDGLEGGTAAAKKILDSIGFGGVVNKDNFDKPTHYFIANETGTEGRAMELKKKIDAYQTKMLSYVDSRYHARIKGVQIDTKTERPDSDGKLLNWQMLNFHHTIILADLVILNKLKSEIQNSELDIINVLYSAVSADDFKFDNVAARVIPKSTYVIQGSNFEADLFVAAYDSKTKLRADLGGGQSLYSNDSGIVQLKLGSGALGPHKYAGKVYVKKEFTEEEYPFSGEYFVAAPTATISLDKMNIFYIGVPNPISISVPGANADQIFPTITGAGASITKVGPGKYEINVKSTGKATISVSANMNGKVMPMGASEYRIKIMPKPTAMVGSSQGGRIERDVLLAQGRLSAIMENFEFNVRYNIKSFAMSFSTGGDAEVAIVSNSPEFTPEMKAKIGRLRRGNKVYIDAIRVVGPDGERAPANPTMMFTIQ